jgi:hypothetical protein
LRRAGRIGVRSPTEEFFFPFILKRPDRLFGAHKASR